MPSQPTRYTLSVTKEDKIFVRLRTEKGKVVEFVVQYYAKTPKGWRTIRRYDTAHHHAHMDIYSFKRKGKVRQVHLEGEYGDILTHAIDEVKLDYQKFKEYYFME
jgi:hypothetical protein